MDHRFTRALFLAALPLAANVAPARVSASNVHATHTNSHIRGPVKTPNVLTWNARAHRAHLTLIASDTKALQTLNFDGYGKGRMVVSVPMGYLVQVIFRNKGPYPHSVVVTTYADRNSTKIFQIAFPGASSPNPLRGTPVGATQTFSFVASRPGTYAIVCAVRKHAQLGMWDEFRVTRGGAPRLTFMSM